MWVCFELDYPKKKVYPFRYNRLHKEAKTLILCVFEQITKRKKQVEKQSYITHLFYYPQ